MSRIGLAGHSLGALAALTAAEKHVPVPLPVVAMSPPAAGVIHRGSNGRVANPTLFMKGTGELTYLDLDPGELKNHAAVYLITVPRAEHALFSDDEEKPQPGREDQIHLVQSATTLFWNAYLRDDVASRAQLSTCAKTVQSCVMPSAQLICRCSAIEPTSGAQ
jgi:hypothetical protein